jgi:virginiamycin B lyase
VVLLRRVAVLVLVALFTFAVGSAGATSGISEFKLAPGARPTELTAGPDGYVWFVEQAAGRIGSISPSGTIHSYTIPTANSQPAGITSGPDGALWFTESGADKIGRYQPGVGFTEYPIPTAASSPRGITEGPDGDLWFCEAAANQVAKITPGGVVTEYPLPIPRSDPARITAAPDGNLWVTQPAANRIAQVTTSGAVSEHAVPSGSTLARITVGPDGALWFAEQGLDRVGRMTTSGALTQYSLPTSGSRPTGITTGADGLLWVTESAADKIASLNPSSGKISTYSLPTTKAVPTGITLGADGNPWLAEYDANRIARANRVTSHVYVIVHDTAYEPTTRWQPLSSSVKWVFEGPNPHTVTDATGMGMFDSGPLTAVTYYTHDFTAAGSYAYQSTTNPGMAGTIDVPVQAPTTGHRDIPFTVTWATSSPTGNSTFDVQVELPGATAYTPWQTAVTTTHAAYTPSAGAGTYRFQARRTDNSGASGWSPAVSVTVG